MSEIFCNDFVALFHLDLDAFWNPCRCMITESGVVLHPIDDLHCSIFIGDELHEILTARNDLELKFPCSKIDLFHWALRNGLGDALPDDFLDNAKDDVSRNCQNELTETLASKQIRQPKKERDLTKWLRETWINEGKPGGTDFFKALKKYVNQPNSPIREHYTTGPNGSGIRWNTGSATNDMTKKAIQNKASAFKNPTNDETERTAAPSLDHL